MIDVMAAMPVAAGPHPFDFHTWRAASTGSKERLRDVEARGMEAWYTALPARPRSARPRSARGGLRAAPAVVARIGAVAGGLPVGGDVVGHLVGHHPAVVELPGARHLAEVVDVAPVALHLHRAGGTVEDEERLAPRLVAVHVEDRLAEQVVHRAHGAGPAHEVGELGTAALEAAVVVGGVLAVTADDAGAIAAVDRRRQHGHELGEGQLVLPPAPAVGRCPP